MRTFTSFGLLLLIACTPPQENKGEGSTSIQDTSGLTITIKGSDTVLPVSREAAERFMDLNPEASLHVVGGGSGVGIAALINNTTDIAMVSRDLNYQEKNALALLGKTMARIVLAYDALAVVVHADNPISQIRMKDLERIYTGKVKNWAELGGPDLEITPCSRETSSGTYEYFKEVTMHDREYAPDVLKMPSTHAVVQTVRETPGAIGYIGIGYLSEGVKALSVYNRVTEEYVEPLLANAQNNTYPIVRPLYYFFLQEDTQRLKPLIDFILSEEGQAIVLEQGYVPL